MTISRERIQNALSYVHHWESRGRGSERQTRAFAAKQVIGGHGLNADEAGILLRALNLTPSDVT